MFGKLLKYEFKAVGKWYIGLYAAAGLLSVIIGLWLHNLLQRSEAVPYTRNMEGVTAVITIEGIGLTAIIAGFAIIIAGLFLSTLFLIVNRFRKNVYGRQGYLTMTLPVNNHQIILSKLTAGFIWSLLSGITTILCFFIILFIIVSPITDDLGRISQILHTIYQNIANVNVALYCFNFIIIGMINSILLIYFAISLGQLFKDHRTLLAVVFYFAINFAEGILNFVLALTLGAYTDPLSATYTSFAILLSTLLCLGYYFGTYYIMTRKLNLQS